MKTLAAMEKLIVIFVLACAGILMLTLRTASRQATATMANLNQTVEQIKTDEANTARLLNGTQGAHYQDGLIVAVKKSVDDVRAASVDVGRQNAKYWTDAKTQTDALLTEGTATLHSARTAIDGLQVTEGKLNASLDRLPDLMQASQELIADPNIKRSFVNFAALSLNGVEMSKSANSILLHVDAMGADLQGGLHKQLHPSRLTIITGGAWQVAKIAATHVP